MSCGASNIALLYYREAANNAAPTFNTSAPRDLRALRLVSEDHNSNQSLDESNEVRGDAQSSGSVITGINGTGSLQLQYSLDTYDDLIAGMLYAPAGSGSDREIGWVTEGFVAPGDVMVLGGTDVITLDGTNDTLDLTIAASWTNTPSAGDRIYVTGTQNRNLDTIWTVESSTATEVVLVNDTGESDIATYAGLSNTGPTAFPAGSVKIYAVKGYTHNSTNESLFGLVRLYSDASAIDTLGAGSGATALTAVDWALFRGALPTGLQLAAAPGTAGWTGTMPFIFKDESVITNASGGSHLGGFNVTDWDEVAKQNTNLLIDAIDGPVMIRLKKLTGAAAVDADYTRVDPLSFNFSITNNAQEISATRNPGAVCINQGTMSMTISLQLLYANATYHQGMLDSDFYEVEFGIGDGDRAQIWRFGKCRYSSSRPNPGKNNPIVQTLDFIVEAGGERMVGYSMGNSADNTDGFMCEVMRTYTADAS